MGEILAGQGI